MRRDGGGGRPSAVNVGVRSDGFAMVPMMSLWYIGVQAAVTSAPTQVSTSPGPSHPRRVHLPLPVAHGGAGVGHSAAGQ